MMTSGTCGHAVEHQAVGRVVDRPRPGRSTTVSVVVDDAHAELAAVDSVTTERGTTTASTGSACSTISALMPAGHVAAAVRDLDLDLKGAGLLRRLATNVAHTALDDGAARRG